MYIDITSNNVLSITNEKELHNAVVNYLKLTDLMFSCPLPIDLNTDNLRIEAVKNGYLCGMPDILIYTPNNKYNGMCLELKNPRGTGNLNKKQYDVLNNFDIECKYFCLVSNDYATIIECLVKYLYDIL